MKKIFLLVALSLSVISQSHALTPYPSLSLGEWRSMCGTPSAQCTGFLAGFIRSSQFWKQYVFGAVKQRPDLEKLPLHLSYATGVSNNGQICFPNQLNYEQVRANINFYLNQQFNERGIVGKDTFLISGTGLETTIYEALRRAYPCKK